MKITDLEKKIGTFHLQIDHLVIESGRIHGIIGPNGCGEDCPFEDAGRHLYT